jgi:hypothetical protein
MTMTTEERQAAAFGSGSSSSTLSRGGGGGSGDEEVTHIAILGNLAREGFWLLLGHDNCEASAFWLKC